MRVKKKFVVDIMPEHFINFQCPFRSFSCVTMLNSSSLIILAAIANDGWAMLLHFIEAELKINTAEYLKILNEIQQRRICKSNDTQRKQAA